MSTTSIPRPPRKLPRTGLRRLRLWAELILLYLLVPLTLALVLPAS
ncbi:hypothetical protein ACFQXB_03265 [Plastorhodobacter daqingensis]|uniref:ABC transporter permease n=1 Tax=Plastorhodobacter daqingensis TaxID=1387281 RepID=A0ABW2UG97_9RHOB